MAADLPQMDRFLITPAVRRHVGATIPLALFGALVLIAPLRIGAAQSSAMHMVLDARTPCRTQPDTAARVVRVYDLGSIIDEERGAHLGTGNWLSTQSAYVSGPHPPCWVARASSVLLDPVHPESALLTLTERASASARTVPFLDLVAIENLLLERYASTLEQSGLLQFRRLLIVEKANAGLDALSRNPLEVAWVRAHGDVLAQDPFSSGAYGLAAPYWALYDRFKAAPWADEIAWHAAQLGRPTDECYSDCVLTSRILEGPMQYWLRLPQGANITAALALATKAAKYAADLACYDRTQRPPLQSDSPVPPQMLDTIRNSLTLVPLEAKRALLDQLSMAEAKCR